MIKVTEFLNSKGKWRDRTIETVKCHLKYWQEWLKDRNIIDVTIDDFEKWSAGKNWSNSMKYNSLWAIKSYLSWEGIQHSLSKHIVKRKIPPIQPFMRQAEVQHLVNICDLNTPKGLQDATIVSFLWETWARASEVIHARVDKLDLKHQEISFYRMKIDDWHTPAFGPDLRGLLEKWLLIRAKIARPNTNTIFINIRRGTPLTYSGLNEILKNLESITGIKTSAHAFRRGGARNYASQGHGDRIGMEQGGWRTRSMYWRYTRGVDLDFFKDVTWMS